MTKKTILITGCSTGIGFKSAQELTNRGYQVIATCRKAEDLKNLEKLGITTVFMDMNDSESITNGFKDALLKTNGQLDVLINNAGYAEGGALEDLSRRILRQQFETNVFGLMELTNLAIAVMRQQGHGRIINLSSILGIISMPFRGAYNASKYAVEGLSDTLRLELKESGIKVISIEPGPISSQFRATSIKRAMQNVNLEESPFKKQYQNMLHEFGQQKTDSVFTQSPNAVIKKFIHAIESKHPKAKYPVTLPAHFFIAMKRLLPTKLLDRIILKLFKNELRN